MLNEMSATRHRMRSLIVITIVLFQSIVNAPVANISLDAEAAASFLRSIWPIFFVLVGVISITGTIKTNQVRARNINLITALCMIACIILVPRINLAMDAGNMTLWKILHMSTVGLTLVSLTLHIWYVVRWHRANND